VQDQLRHLHEPLSDKIANKHMCRLMMCGGNSELGSVPDTADCAAAASSSKNRLRESPMVMFCEFITVRDDIIASDSAFTASFALAAPYEGAEN